MINLLILTFNLKIKNQIMNEWLKEWMKQFNDECMNQLKNGNVDLGGTQKMYKLMARLCLFGWFFIIVSWNRNR